jgi:hypothetical protein
VSTAAVQSIEEQKIDDMFAAAMNVFFPGAPFFETETTQGSPT